MTNHLPCPMRTEGKKQTFAESKGQAPVMKYGVYRTDIGKYTGLFPIRLMAENYARDCYGSEHCIVDDLSQVTRKEYKRPPGLSRKTWFKPKTK